MRYENHWYKKSKQPIDIYPNPKWYYIDISDDKAFL